MVLEEARRAEQHASLPVEDELVRVRAGPEPVQREPIFAVLAVRLGADQEGRAARRFDLDWRMQPQRSEHVRRLEEVPSLLADSAPDVRLALVRASAVLLRVLPPLLPVPDSETGEGVRAFALLPRPVAVEPDPNDVLELLGLRFACVSGEHDRAHAASRCLLVVEPLERRAGATWVMPLAHRQAHRPPTLAGAVDQLEQVAELAHSESVVAR